MGKSPIKLDIKKTDTISKESKEILDKVGSGEYSVPKSVIDKSLEDQAQRIMREGKNKEDLIKTQEDLIKTQEDRIKELEVELVNIKDRLEQGPPTHQVGNKFIEDLRKQDIPKVNRTCRCCSRRVPLKLMERRGIEFCVDCLSK